jgi:hypothetical protein
LASIGKRYLMTVAAHNLGLIMRKLFGVGKPKGLRAAIGLANLLWIAMRLLKRLIRAAERLQNVKSMKVEFQHPLSLAGWKRGKFNRLLSVPVFIFNLLQSRLHEATVFVGFRGHC